MASAAKEKMTDDERKMLCSAVLTMSICTSCTCMIVRPPDLDLPNALVVAILITCSALTSAAMHAEGYFKQKTCRRGSCCTDAILAVKVQRLKA